jgi:NitT/TauT family transport system substrate-binding protein
MFKIKKSFRKMVVAALLTLIVLASCSPSKSTPQFKLRIGLFPVQDYLPFFVMQENGFDKQNGLQFGETSYAGGAAIIDAIVAGLLDVGYVGSVPVFTAAERGLMPDKIVVVAANNFADPDHPGVGVLVSTSVKGWKDLNGQHIAVVSINSLHGAAANACFQKEGVRDYRFVEIPFANMGLAVVGGNVAAATMSDPFLTQSLLRGDGKLLGWVIGGPPFEHMEFSMIVFRANYYQNNPQAVKAFLRAHLQAVKWINQNEKEARSILVKRLQVSQDVGKKVHLLRWPLDARNEPALLESMQPLLVEIGMLKTPIPAHKLYDETLLEEVLKEQK